MRYLFLLNVLLLFGLSSCKKDPLKLPVQIEMRTSFIASDISTAQHLTYNDVRLNVKAVHLVANTSEEDSIAFYREFDQVEYLGFNQNSIEDALDFALPARVYSSIQLRFELDQTQGAGLILYGTFTDQGTTEPVLIEFNTVSELLVSARQNGLEGPVDLTNLTKTEGQLNLNPAFWTITLSKQNLVMADRQLVDNESTIIINEQQNQTLFQTLENRINLKNYLEF